MPFDGTEISEAAQRLMLTKQYIIDHGWLKGKVQDKYGRVCVLGAFQKISGDVTLKSVSRDVRYFQRAIGNVCVSSWNDSSYRTLTDVLNAFDKAIELAMADG